MASLEFIQKRIAGKEKEISTLEKKLARIEAAKATNWEKNPYYYGEADLSYTQNDLTLARKALDKYRADLVTAQEKASSRNIPVILEFLNQWKQRMSDYYKDMFATYIKAYDEYVTEYNRLTDALNHIKFNTEEYRDRLSTIRKNTQDFNSTWNFLTPYLDRVYDDNLQKHSRKFNADRFQKDIDQEADAKYDFLIERVNAIAGELVDASDLRIGDTGELNGTVIGRRGKAKITTVGAGGYNIQCFHFRTLVHEVH